LVAAAVLAHRGYKVVVLEETPHLGSRVGGQEHEGYWIDWGHRDGHGISDLAFAPVFTERAAQEAGVELPLRPFTGKSLKVHWLPEKQFTELPAEAVVGGGEDPVGQMVALCRCFGLASGREDVVATEALGVLGRLAGMDDDVARSNIPASLDDWLRRHTEDPDVRRLILQQNALVPLGPNESLGRFVSHLKTFSAQPSAVIADDDKVGGVQGLVRAFGEAVSRRGGEIWLGWKPWEIIVEDNEVRGVVALDSSSLVQVFEAPIVVTDYLGTQLGDLLDPGLLPAGFVDQARETEKYGTEICSWWAALDRLPTVRHDGSTEDFSTPWHRMFRGRGDVRQCYGGWMFPSAFSRRSAPPGKHLLTMWTEPVTESGQPGWPRWKDAEEALDLGVDYLTHYYSDLEDCIEWSRYQYVSRPAVLLWYARPVYRHPTKISTIDGLFVGSASSESVASYLDIECEAGLRAACLADEERGHLVGRDQS
jgi:phytoene dehydrogenase-like protein